MVAKILINNTALRNNGDVALVRSLGYALRDRGHKVTVAGSTSAPGGREICGLPVSPEVVGYRLSPFRVPVLADLAALARLLGDANYRNADVLIGAPGGYLNSFYGFHWKLRAYRWARRFGRKTAIYSQSVGPLRERDKAGLRDAGRFLDALVVRDGHSHEIAMQAGFPVENLQLTDDAVFLTTPRVSMRSRLSNRVLFSVRDWKHEGRESDRYDALMHGLMRVVLSRGFEIQFLSTCQGIAGYVDDSTVADRIVGTYTGDKRFVTVCHERLSLEDLEERIDAARLVVGTRLHMCLLAMLAGIPAFNVSYEAKGIECYSYLGLADYSVDYNAAPAVAAGWLEKFLDSSEQLRERIVAEVAMRHRAANNHLDRFLASIGIANVE
jgi:polysaccharide pyruvyl transferase WcaK-like protein